ncbi:MAG: hypothetical protein OXF09_02870, partial [Hyphomicrobiales bacterium]|nr:hypothetical protein [Hyphomicrobiales bacterium]
MSKEIGRIPCRSARGIRAKRTPGRPGWHVRPSSLDGPRSAKEAASVVPRGGIEPPTQGFSVLCS